MKKTILLIAVPLLAIVSHAQSQGAKSLVLEKNEGEKRMRRPFGSLPIPGEEFILKVTPQKQRLTAFRAGHRGGPARRCDSSA